MNKLIFKTKFQEILGIGKDTSIGMALLKKNQPEFDYRVETIRNVCDDEGYRLSVEQPISCYFTQNIRQ
jgi:hypothetical protein